MLMRRFHRSKQAGTAALGGVLVAGDALAALVPGRGSNRFDCYVELDVHGASGSNHITCTDGDPTCDVDGKCDGTCTFSIAVCVNQTNIPECTPTALRRPPVVSKSLRSNLPIIQGAAPACGLPSNVTVKVGRRATKLFSRAKKDKDHLFLKCQPRTDACPLQTTTTPTSSTTTTTTRP